MCGSYSLELMLVSHAELGSLLSGGHHILLVIYSEVLGTEFAYHCCLLLDDSEAELPPWVVGKVFNLSSYLWLKLIII